MYFAVSNLNGLPLLESSNSTHMRESVSVRIKDSLGVVNMPTDAARIFVSCVDAVRVNRNHPLSSFN